MKRLLTALILSTVALAVPAAEPPEIINYQGVLRDNLDNALDGAHDMIFYFFDTDGGATCAGGILLLTDSHLAAGTGAVDVTGGMFSVQIGTGSLVPGSESTLSEVFRDNEAVWAEIWVEGEKLCPRIRIVSAGYSLNADHLDGEDSSFFLDTSSSDQWKYGRLFIDAPVGYGIQSYGPTGGGILGDSNSSGYSVVGHGNYGVSSYGSFAGGYFQDTDNTGQAFMGHGNLGTQAWGSQAGGYFYDSNSSGYAYVGYGDTGIDARGSSIGGYFADIDGGSYAYVGYGPAGIEAFGAIGGGHFEALCCSGGANVGAGDLGIEAYGDDFGGVFRDDNDSGIAYVGSGDRGIWGKGSFAGATFSTPDDVTVWADVAQQIGGTKYKIRGNGTNGFVQNHPYDLDRVVVYTAPEGDETAVYTRGTARLVDGEARVTLGETFQWVANPDIGLTAHLTPHGEAVPLAVLSLTTEEMVVQGPADVAFDYLVFGLRIGFEQTSHVAPKDREAPLPGPDAAEGYYGRYPELRRYTALERYKQMAMTATGIPSDALDLSGAAELRAAIGAAGRQGIGKVDPEAERPEIGSAENSEAETVTRPEPLPVLDFGSEAPRGATAATILVPGGSKREEEAEEVAESSTPAQLPVTVEVEVGDLLSLDLERTGMFRRADRASDHAVVGIAAAEPRTVDGVARVPVATFGFSQVKADASFGAIRAGDLLVTSPHPGHAMLAVAPVPGTLVGKALEPLDTGTGLIKVLVTLH